MDAVYFTIHDYRLYCSIICEKGSNEVRKYFGIFLEN